MGYHTRETNTVPCGYHELNPEMEALLAEYLEDGKRKGLQESSIHLHDKIGHYFLSTDHLLAWGMLKGFCCLVHLDFSHVSGAS